jgi:hypothetical protein
LIKIIPLGWVALFIDFDSGAYAAETFSPNRKCNHILANLKNSGVNNLAIYDQKILACQSGRNCSAYNEHTSQWDAYIPFPFETRTINGGK